MRIGRRGTFFVTLASILCFFLVCLPNIATLSNNNGFKPAEATSGLNLRLVGNIVNHNDWNNTNDKWVFNETSSGVYEIKKVYMIAYDNDSNFRIVKYSTWDGYGYSHLSNGNNEPGFTSAGSDNNIHITKTGYYDIKLYNNESKIDITVSELTLTGNIENNGSGWSTTPNSGNWKLTKSNNMDYKIEHVYMVSHNTSDFRIIPWGWVGNNWPTNIGYTQLTRGNNNKPGFTQCASESYNIHITETGRYNIYLWWNGTANDWAIDIYYDDDQYTDLECQIWVDGSKKINPSGFNFNFKYNNNVSSSYSSLGESKTISTARCGRLFYVTGWSCPVGYYLTDYRIGYTDNTTPYTVAGSSSANNAVTHYETGTRNYIIAYFSKAYYTITYNKNGGSADSPASQSVQVGSTVTFRTYSGTKTGYTFAGWNTNSSGTGTHYNAGGTGTPSTAKDGTLALFAQWTPNTYTITYKDRGGGNYSGSNSGSLVTDHVYGTSTALVSGVKSGYLFKGWYNNSACSGSAITSVGATVQNITLYAKFVKKPSTSPVFVLVGDTTFNQSTGIGGSASSPTWEYFTSNQEMGDTPGDNQQAAKNNVALSSGATLKFTKYHDGDYDGIWASTDIDMRDDWAGTYLMQDGDGNFVVKPAGDGLLYNFYVGNDNHLHMYPAYHNVHMKGVFVRGNTSTVEASDLTPDYKINGIALHTKTYTAPVSPWGDGYTYGGVKYTFEGWYTDSTLTTAYTSTSNVTSDITIYAKFVDLNNYLTYNHNDGSGTTQLVDPSHFDATQYILSYSDLGWSDSYFRSFSNWNTESNGSGTRYDLGDDITVTGATTLYAQQNWHQVYISVDNGRTWTATTTSFPDGMQIQYETEKSIIVDSDHAVIKIKYRNVNTGVETVLDNDKDLTFTGNNYNSETHGVNVSFTDKIRLKVLNGNSLECEIPGATERTLQIVHTDGTVTAVGLVGSTNTQVVSDGYVYVRAGDKIWAKHMTASAYKSYYMSGAGFQRDDDDDGIAECTVTGAYTIYLQEGDYQNWRNVVVSRDETESAAYFARLFNRKMCAICDNYDTNTASSFIDAWQQNATENAVTVFGELSSTVQAGLKGTTYNEDDDVIAFKAKYNYILSKYGYGTGSGELRDFLGATPALSAIRSFSPFNLVNGDDENNLSTIIIIVASSISLLSITVLSVLVVKKKQKKNIL